jgi:hypothetical protein
MQRRYRSSINSILKDRERESFFRKPDFPEICLNSYFVVACSHVSLYKILGTIIIYCLLLREEHMSLGHVIIRLTKWTFRIRRYEYVKQGR